MDGHCRAGREDEGGEGVDMGRFVADGAAHHLHQHAARVPDRDPFVLQVKAGAAVCVGVGIGVRVVAVGDCVGVRVKAVGVGVMVVGYVTLPATNSI